MTYLILIIALLVIGIIVFTIFKHDFLSPSILSIFFFLIAVAFAFIGTFTWNTEANLNSVTVFIILIGIVSFIFGEILSRNTTKDKNINKKGICIEISRKKVIISIIFIIITMLLMIIEIKKVCGRFGYYSNNIADLLAYYRNLGNLFSNEITQENDINFLVKQMNKMCVALGIVFSYIYANNYYHKDKFKKINILLIPIILSMVETLLTSGRALFMKMAMAFIFLILLYYFKKKKNDKVNFKVLIFTFLGFIFLGILFYLILPFIGRNTSSSFIDYVTFYFGCGIPSLNNFINNIPVHSQLIGEETFTGIYLLLNKFRIVNFTRITEYSWVFFSGLGSNIFTSFRAYFFDFGWIGLILCQFIYGFVSSKFYLSIKKIDNSILIPIYGYFACTFIEQIRAEQFFGLFSSTFLSYIIYFFIVYVFLINRSDSIRGESLKK